LSRDNILKVLSYGVIPVLSWSSTKVDDKVYILLFNSCVECHSKTTKVEGFVF